MRPEALNQTNDLLKWTFVDGAESTVQLPMSLGQIRRCWGDRKDGEVRWLFCLFLINSGEVLLGGKLQEWGMDMEGLGDELDATCLMTLWIQPLACCHASVGSDSSLQYSLKCGNANRISSVQTHLTQSKISSVSGLPIPSIAWYPNFTSGLMSSCPHVLLLSSTSLGYLICVLGLFSTLT